jgi:Carboxypeptidase regulatory-like domain
MQNFSIVINKFLLVFVLLIMSFSAFSQVTTSSISGVVTDAKGEELPGATVVALHTASGSRYGTVTNAFGRYTLPAVRVGGPFSITVTFTGFDPKTQDGIFTSLGTAANVDFSIAEAGVTIGEVTVTALRNDVFSSDRTGAAQTFGKNMLATVPIIGSRNISDITKYNPNGNGKSFGGQDSRLNNFTVDGSSFNNGFGLGTESQAGGRNGTTAISLDAIEEVQVNVAPFDVRQSGFVGSGINAVTRSGTNDFSGSVYFTTRDNSKTFNGSKAAGNDVTIGKFNEKVTGFRLGGPIIKDKLFFFVNAEIFNKVEPATAFVADGSSNPGTKTRVAKADLDGLSSFLKTKYNYETGAYENFDNEVASAKFLARIDYNISNAHKLSLRYTHHNSTGDFMISNSASLGAGARRTNTESMAYQNSGYVLNDNTRSIVTELNSTFSDKIHNSFIIGYDLQDEDRAYTAAPFPTVDILKDGKNYISFGFDPFTPDNKLNYGNFHATNNVSVYLNKHTITVGANYEKYKSNNSFFPGSNGVYIFNSLDDFYAAANSTADTSPVKINTFQYRYSALEQGADPVQVLKVNKFDIYGQDEFQVTKRLKLTAGVRLGAISFGQTALENTKISELAFNGIDEARGYKINTATLPKTKILFEPRFGFNFDVLGNKKTQLRGGTGVFTGRPPYVWVSNQIGNNGILTGFIEGKATTKYAFRPDATSFTPATPTLPSTFDIAATDPNYKFPQIWKTSIAVDQKLPLGLVASVELLYNKNVNAINYWNANMELAADTARFKGPDNRVRFPASGLSGAASTNAIRANDNVSNAIVMTTTNQGSYTGVTLKLEYPNKNGFYGMVAYTKSMANDLMSAGSIASGSWTGVKTVNGNNNLDLARADGDLPNRMIGLLGYRLDYGKKFGGATSITLGYIGEESGRYSFAIAGDMNGDGVRDNELLYVPNSASEMVFKKNEIKDAAGVVVKTFTPEEQQAAFDAFINQDKYLSTMRGKYTERNGAILPWLHRFDLSLVQEVAIKGKKNRNALQFRFDILNFGNLVSDKFGVGNIKVTERPITFASVTADGTPEYRFATTGTGTNTSLITSSLSSGTNASDVWSAQFGVRYIFN